MKKYVFMRILRSLVSIFLVTALVYSIVYTMVPRRYIFKQDPNYTKMSKTPDMKADYENTIYERVGYLEYYNSKELQQHAESYDSTVTVDNTPENKKIYEAYIKQLGKGWKLYQFKESGQFYAVREVPIYERVFEFYANLIQIDHPWKIQDKNNPDLERYVKFENDPAVGPALVGSGTEHKYLIYFNGSFPFIHQNIVTFNLGTSYPTYQGAGVLDVITQGQGQTATSEVTFPTGAKKTSSVNIYTRSYQSPSTVDSKTAANYEAGDAYTKTKTNYKDPSMIASSSIIGLIGVIISYTVGIPLGMLMARYKNKAVDTGFTAVLNFMLAMPSVALVYIVTMLGGALGLPNSFPILGAADPRSYILPSLILGIFSIPSLAIWMRRYLIDQQSSDYVRFARAKGLSEREVAQNHILKNAMVPIVVGIPAAIVSVVVGATLTESIFAFPGMGKMLIDSIRASNNAMVVGLTFIFTSLSIFATLAGDILMTMLDPRIKLSTKGGK